MECKPHFTILVQILINTLRLEVRFKSFVRPREHNSGEPVKLFELDGRWRVQGHQSDYARFDFGGWPELILRHVHHIVHFGVELDVGREPGPGRRPWTCDETHRKLTLKHENSRAEKRPVREETEYDARGDLVGCVGDANVKVR